MSWAASTIMCRNITAIMLGGAAEMASALSAARKNRLDLSAVDKRR